MAAFCRKLLTPREFRLKSRYATRARARAGEAASMAVRIGTAIPSTACIRTVPSDMGDTANMSRALTYSAVIAPVVLLAATIFLATLAHAQSSGPGLGFWGSGGG